MVLKNTATVREKLYLGKSHAAAMQQRFDNALATTEMHEASSLAQTYRISKTIIEIEEQTRRLQALLTEVKRQLRGDAAA